nr:helix-turn-helix domain-containing protein [Candidatus Sigynarchaeota archaeon]
MAEKYEIDLTAEQVATLEKLTTSGEAKARTFKRAMILLACNQKKRYKEIMEFLHVSETMIKNTKRNFHLLGLEGALHEKDRPGQPKKVTPEVKAKLFALACEAPPVGRNAWTVTLLMEELETRFSIDLGWGTIQRTLAEDDMKPWKKKCGAFLP